MDGRKSDALREEAAGAAAPAAGPRLIDTHCHLDMLPAPALAMGEAREAGVAAVLTVGIDLLSSHAAVRLAGENPDVWATVGVHPHEARRCTEELLVELDELAAGARVVAIGECGLDYYRDLSPRDDQRRAFVAQMELARRHSLPLVVHVREAGEEALGLLAEHAAGLAVFLHCFSLAAWVDECVERDYYASFAGNLTYKNAADLRAAAARIPQDRLLVETDAPFLAPVPHRGQSNHPALVRYTAAVLAGVRGWSLEQAARVTAANARRVFGLPGDEAA
jgi:TatD DNase family protein